MPAIIDIAPQGDLVVAIGEGHAQKLARISSTLVKLASPVFRAILGPSFKEGQCTLDASSPFKLPGDDPTSTLNLFRILHYNGNEADTTDLMWLQELVIVCDKYQCTPKLRDYISLKMHEMPFRHIDSFIISGLTGDAKFFRSYSNEVVRLSKDAAKYSGYPRLLELIPEDMLGNALSFIKFIT